MDTEPDLPVLAFESQKAWGQWLHKHHATSRGLWLKIAKAKSGIHSVSYGEALEVALCYGWIDGQKGVFNESFWLQRFTPRKPRSKWSKVNCAKATELISQGRMKPTGMRQVELAKQDGRWDAAYDSQRNATVPEDLQCALDAHPKASAFFGTLKGANRYAILYRIQDAKKPETRARRIEKFISMLEEQKKIHN